jgi:hypothetical protein
MHPKKVITEKPVLPTSGKEFWTGQLKSSAAGEKIQYLLSGAVLQAPLSQISSKNSGANPHGLASLYLKIMKAFM